MLFIIMKRIRNILFFIFSLHFISGAVAQTNLVKNPSFEDTIKCPDVWGYVDPYVKFWHNPSGESPDYYNICADNSTGCNVPNALGFQYPKSGNAYCGLFASQLSSASAANGREYIQGKLTQNLQAGKRYTVSFYVSLANFSTYSINRIGAYLSDTLINDTTIYNLPFIPQINNPTNNQLNDTLNWMLISGDFIANGGEQFITIGNFYNDVQTDTSVISNGSVTASYYYVDSVSVITYAETPAPVISLFIPTIISGDQQFTIKGLPANSELYLFNVLGQLVYKRENYNSELNALEYSTGIYYYRLQTTDGNTYKGKLCIIH